MTVQVKAPGQNPKVFPTASDFDTQFDGQLVLTDGEGTEVVLYAAGAWSYAEIVPDADPEPATDDGEPTCQGAGVKPDASTSGGSLKPFDFSVFTTNLQKQVTDAIDVVQRSAEYQRLLRMSGVREE